MDEVTILELYLLYILAYLSLPLLQYIHVIYIYIYIIIYIVITYITTLSFE